MLERRTSLRIHRFILFIRWSYFLVSSIIHQLRKDKMKLRLTRVRSSCEFPCRSPTSKNDRGKSKYTCSKVRSGGTASCAFRGSLRQTSLTRQTSSEMSHCDRTKRGQLHHSVQHLQPSLPPRVIFLFSCHRCAKLINLLG